MSNNRIVQGLERIEGNSALGDQRLHRANAVEPDKPTRSQFLLADRNIHVWSVPIQSGPVVAWFKEILSPDERIRAAQFRYGHLQRSFILARGALRIMLGHYLGIRPNDISFLYGAKGKPRVDAATPLQFNVSHSGGLAVFAFTLGCEIGIDIEEIRTLPDIQSIAKQFFCSEEVSQLASIPTIQREHAFFLCWTRKEAYLKAIGDGLSAPLNSFCVTIDPAEPVRLVHIENDRCSAATWNLHDLAFLSDQHAATLAYCDAIRPLRLIMLAEPTDLCGIT